MKKIIIIILAVSVLVASLGANLYHFGWKKLESKLREEGFNIAVNYIIKQVNEKGEVKINDNLILIKKITE